MAVRKEIQVRVGISSCLLGKKVRYDGSHKHDHYITDTLGRYFQFVPVCPEVECGLPVPREAMRLVGPPDAPRLVTIRSGVDHTEMMREWTKKKLHELEKEDLCGFIFKSRSPSSGMERVKVYDSHNVPRSVGVGIFAKAFMEHFPLLPVEDEGRLHDPSLRENFIEAIFVYRNWRAMLAAPTVAVLVDFHTTHKLQLRAHSEKHYRELGRLVAGAGNVPLEELLTHYQKELMAAIRLKPTVKKHANVIFHMMGYFKKALSKDEKQELLEVIDSFRKGNLPLIVPITLMNHYICKYGEVYLRRQHYLAPHPMELKLRNHS